MGFLWPHRFLSCYPIFRCTALLLSNWLPASLTFSPRGEAELSIVVDRGRRTKTAFSLHVLHPLFLTGNSIVWGAERTGHQGIGETSHFSLIGKIMLQSRLKYQAEQRTDQQTIFQDAQSHKSCWNAAKLVCAEYSLAFQILACSDVKWKDTYQPRGTGERKCGSGC